MKVLIVGLGSIAKKHIDALLMIEKDVEIFALRSSLNSNKLPNIKDIYNFDELPEGLDFIIISTPTHLHYKYIELFASKRIPLFIEKPLVHEMNGLDKLISQLNANNVFTYIACNLRFHPCLQYVNNYIKRSPDLKINEVNVYCGSYLPDWRQGKDFKQVYSANAAMGGGVHLDLFHELDYVTWIFGLPNQSAVVTSNKSSLKIDAIDYANYNLRYNTFNANIVLNYYRITPKRTFEILFDTDIWIIDLIENNITNAYNEIIFEDRDFKIVDTYRLQLAYFTQQMKGDKAIMNTAQESATVLKVCLINE